MVFSQVNGKELKNMLHQHVVDLFRTAGDKVSLKVQHRVCIILFLGIYRYSLKGYALPTAASEVIHEGEEP